MILYNLQTLTFTECTTQVGFGIDRPSLSFSWLVPPSISPTNWSFAIGGGFRVEKFELVGGVVQMTTHATFPLPASTDDERLCCTVNAMDFLSSPSGSSNGYLFVATSNGRIFALEDLNDGSLVFTRLSSDESNPPNGAIQIPVNQGAFPWYANRTFGHETAFDLYTEKGSGVNPDKNWLYVAEFGAPIADPDPTADGPLESDNSFRLGRLLLDPADPTYTFEEHWYPDVTDTRNGLSARNAAFFDGKSTLTRFLEVDDKDENGSLESYCLAERGAIWKRNKNNIRKFCTHQADASLFGHAGSGGYVFEEFAQFDHAVLTNDTTSEFRTPRTDTSLYTNGSAAAEWWFPVFGANVITGQISNHATGSFGTLWGGTSMAMARLIDPTDGVSLKEYIVTGTIGGYVYAVRPGSTVTGEEVKQSKLHYASQDLGWYAIGLDTGDLDGDGEDEIVVGTLVDDGSFNDWDTPTDTHKNRGVVTILKTTGTILEGGFTRELLATQTIDGDNTLGTGFGLGAGIFGIKIDNVDNVGPPEIWATDAVGHIYLLRDSGTGAYSVWYRSGHVGTYPGLFNNLFPVKNQSNQTTRLAVVSSGYLMVFDVDFLQLTQ